MFNSLELKSGIARRLASPAARFRYAVGVGFVITAVGVGSLAATGIGHADDLFSSFGGLFGTPAASPQYAATPRSRVHRHQPRLARRHAPSEPPILRVTIARHAGSTHHEGPAHHEASVEHDAPRHLGGRSMCVRLCDGFAFPVGDYHGDGDRASHEATCQSECPGAKTALYVLPGGSDTIGDAVDVKSGRGYSKIPSAFHYTTFLQDSCSCHPREGSRIASLLHDFTLRRGDAVMTRNGLKVFHGGQFPHRQKDFVALSKSRDVSTGRMPTFHAIERAGAAAPAPNVITGPTPAASTPPAKQASLTL